MSAKIQIYAKYQTNILNLPIDFENNPSFMIFLAGKVFINRINTPSKTGRRNFDTSRDTAICFFNKYVNI